MSLVNQDVLAGLILLLVLVLGAVVVTSNIEGMFDYCEEHPNATCCPGSNTLCTTADLHEKCIDECRWAVETGKLTGCVCGVH